MSIRQRFAQWVLRNAWDSSQIKYGSPAWESMFGAPSKLAPLNETSALTISSIYGCVSLLSGVISSLPMNIYRRDSKGFKDEAHDDQMWWMLNEQMSDRWSAAVAWEFLGASLLLHGNAYAEIVRSREGRVLGLKPVHPDRVEVYLNGDVDRLVYAVSPEPNSTVPKSTRTVFDQDDIIHVAGLGFDGIKGLSPLRYALRMTGAVANETQNYAANFFANAARPDYALTSEKNLTTEQVDQLREQIAQKHQGTSAHKPMVLHGGMDIKTISLPIEDLQLIDIRKFQVEEIARVYGVHPVMIGHSADTSFWGSGVEVVGTNFVRYTLRRHLNKFETEFNRKLIRNGPKTLAFDTSELERADMKTFIEGLRSGIGRAGEKPLMSQNEARKKMNLKPVPDGDDMTAVQPAKAPGADPQKDTSNAQPTTA